MGENKGKKRSQVELVVFGAKLSVKGKEEKEPKWNL